MVYGSRPRGLWRHWQSIFRGLWPHWQSFFRGISSNWQSLQRHIIIAQPAAVLQRCIAQPAVLNYSYRIRSHRKLSALHADVPKLSILRTAILKQNVLQDVVLKIHLKKGFPSVILKNPHCKQFVLNYFYCKLPSCIICNTNSHRQIFIFKQAVILNNSCSKQTSLTFSIKDSHPYYRQPL